MLIGLAPLLAGAGWQQPDATKSSAGGPQAKVTNPHGAISTPCQSCHTYTSWKPIRSNPEFNHDQTGYPLRGMHEKVACTKCHTDLKFKNVSTHCSDCHADIHRRQFGANCESCHSVKGWQVSTQQIKDHQNRFPLVGAHAMLQCDDCHKNAAAGQFVGLSTACYSCHQKDYQTPVINHAALGFPTTCESCHTMDTWFNAKFDHLKYTGYALTGAHTTLPCAACHVNNVFAGTSATCYGCHQTDFTHATNPNHVAAGFPTTCASCHTTTAWTPATFDHSTFFPLTGAHATLTCAQCHTNNNYSNLPTTCVGCHQTDFNNTTNPGHQAAKFPTTCTTCHNTSNWTTVTFDHATYANYPLTGAHAALTCVQCHANNNYTNTSTNCYSCHQADFNGTTSPAHKAQGFPTDCSLCHTTSGWSPSSFNHNAVFPLTGAHATVTCAQCHTNNNFSTLPTTCVGCHQADFNNTTNPNHPAASFPTSCTTCHNTTDWTTVTFDHATYAKYPLTGVHASLTCAQCHTNNNYTNTPTDCYSCHQADFNGTTNPAHKAQGFPTDCSLCHTTSGWNPSSFNHASVFPLTGAHASLTCAQCHTNNNFTSLPTTCVGCHQSDWNGTTDPKHSATNFPTTCDTCHNTTAWTTSNFNHNTWTTFQLTGAHTTVDCNTCHTSNNYTTLSTTCYGCHTADYNGTTDPAHKSQGFPTDCTMCHSTTAWTGSTFNHNSVFPLTGAHATLTCVQCHTNNNYTSLPTTCIGCHQTDFNNTNNPSHAAAGFPTTCTTCHSTTDWTTLVAFNHATYAKYPLTGAHASLTCAQCHANNNYTNTAADCYSCHKADFNGTTNPNHAAQGFPTTCSMCHTTSAWTPSSFNHNAVFALTGAHASLTCVQCHTNNNYTTLPTTCVGCHQADFNGTTNPSHTAAGFPTTCTTCHNTSSWTTVTTFDHATYAKYPLTGAHASLTCVQCHKNNNYTNLPTTCVSCHQSDWNGTTNPKHSATNFPQTCETCHNTTTWTTSTFNHGTYANYPLTGAHATLTCAQCHTNNNYTNLPTACYSCHQADFTGTTSPAHVAQGFPTDCTLCHTTSGWSPSSFNHASVFALTGAHATLTCAQCHTNNNYTTLPTTCVGCHQTDWNGTTDPKHSATNFPNTCETCHNTTAWTTSTFNHNTWTGASAFQLTGAHTSVDCNSCHTSNNYTTLSTTCYGCHTADYNGTTNPAHKSQGFPTDCTMCHSTTAWTTSTFNHASVFPLTGAHATLTCAQCHTNNNYTTLPTTCVGCHQSDWNGTTDPKHSATNFPTTCDTCHNTTAWTTSTFNHNTWAGASVFQLTGAHTTVDCNQCHTSNNYTTLSTTCYGCHTADYNGTTNPPHQAQGFPTDCTMCHTTTAWTGSTFNHASVFPLTGAHATLTCAQCHTNNNYTTLPTTCVGCHQADWNGTTDPKHSATNFPNTCETCHNTTAWTTSTFNHNTWTGASVFQLTGAHTTVDCNQCHTNNNYTTLPTTCYGCHTADYNGTTNPAHQSQGFPTDCTMCHTTTAWTGSTFNHNNTGFPLTGAHLNITCSQCHKNGNYTLGATTCYTCHTADWTGTTDPGHAAAGFPTTCDTCHTTSAWTGATFNHNNTPFPLTGAHTTVDCIKCHINNVYAGTPTDCYSCHQADYNGTTNPNHAAAKWPTTCTTCHTTTAWTPATLPTSYHTFFPLNHGNANGVCTTCHTNSSDYSVFTCTGCHTQAKTDPEHKGISGYVYNSVNCYACHKNGSS